MSDDSDNSSISEGSNHEMNLSDSHVDVLSSIINSSQVISSHSSANSHCSAVPLPQVNEENDSYCKTLIPYVFNQEKEIVAILQSIGSIKFLVDTFTSCTKKKTDHLFIKNLWTLLCIISGNSMSMNETKDNRFVYFQGVGLKFNETLKNIHLNSFFYENLIQMLPNHKIPSEFYAFVEVKKSGSRAAFTQKQ